MSRKDQMYSIGELAKMSNASVKQLRYLDEKGILVPKLRDRDNNYRYYAPEQLNKLVIIKTLRDLGFSFEDVVVILEDKQKDKFTAAIRKQIKESESEIRQAIFRHERLSSYYTNFLYGNNCSEAFELRHEELTGRFELISVPKQLVVFSRNKASASSGQLFIDRFFELQKICMEERIASFSSMIAIFHDGYMKQFDGVSEDLETMIVVPEDSRPGKRLRMFGGFKGITFTHKGHYSVMKKLYQELEAWAGEKGIEIINAAIEIYQLGPDMTPIAESYTTQVIVPVKGSIL
ncbi:MAG: MerR family transcriptional regulator [Lachnospiraceae bacterium]